MIFDLIVNSSPYEILSPRLALAFRALRQGELLHLPDGRHPLQGDDVFALIQQYPTKPHVGAQLETHRRYIDIQCLLAGEELVGYAPAAGLPESIPYNTEKDIAFHAGTPELLLHLRPTNFALFFPQDAHMPSLQLPDQPAAAIKKIVLKIRV